MPNDTLAVPPATPGAGSPAPVFVLTTGRSGSTLLRFILDSHPDLACPPETGIAAACVQLAGAWHTLEHAGSADQPNVTAPLTLSPRARAAIRGAVDAAFAPYLADRGKTRWCEKSLDTCQYADIVAQVYPAARFICLVRHCMDVVASGVEACPWGLHRFGFGPFAARYPGNSVAAVGAYWLTRTQAILGFRENNPDRCQLVRYEDLVTDPEHVMSRVFDFIGVRPVPGITDAAFHLPHDGNGPGDEKIWFTDGISTASLGRGRQVPASALLPDLRQGINQTLESLGYLPVADDWRRSGYLDPRADASPAATDSVPADSDPAVATVLDVIERRVFAGKAGCWAAEIARHWPVVAGVTVEFVVQAGTRQQARPFTFPGTAADPGTGPRMVAGAQTWLAVLTGRSNLVAEITAGRVRFTQARDAHRLRSAELHAVAALLGLATIPVARLPRVADEVPATG